MEANGGRRRRASARPAGSPCMNPPSRARSSCFGVWSVWGVRGQAVAGGARIAGRQLALSCRVLLKRNSR
eukprot:10293942-Alexandrium_andersonii.AAC.1